MFVSSTSLYSQSFVDNGDGTISNKTTGCTWQKCSAGQDPMDCSGRAVRKNWREAVEYCKNLKLANKKWRLPNIKEFNCLVNYNKCSPTINTKYFPKTGASYYWTSTTPAGVGNYACYVDFSFGNESCYSKSYKNYVRCIAD